MWDFFKNAQNWTDITKSYRVLVDEYKEFGKDLLNIKEEF